MKIKPSRKRASLRYMWLVAVLTTASGQSPTDLATANDLEAALYDVLSHGNLFDAAYLSDRLQIGLRTSRPKALDLDATRFEGIATASPPVLNGSIEYYADVDRARKVSMAHFRFGSRSCASLRQWASEWHVQTSAGMSTDGGPPYESLVWPGSEGISLLVTTAREGCGFELSQTVQRVVDVPLTPKPPRASAIGLSRQITDLLHSDLRDYAQVGRILDTEVIIAPEAQREGLLYNGSPFPGRVIRGFKPYFYYDGNDSGWYQPPGFFARPLHIRDRSVFLNLTVDSDVACLTRSQLKSYLKQRNDRTRIRRGVSGDESVYSVGGATW